MAKQSTQQLNQRLTQIVNKNEPSVYTKDVKQALSSKSPQDKRTAITEYNKWQRS